MDNTQSTNASSGIMKRKYTSLKEQQCSLNMQIRLAMQLQNKSVQEDLEKQLEEVTKQLKYR